MASLKSSRVKSSRVESSRVESSRVTLPPLGHATGRLGELTRMLRGWEQRVGEMIADEGGARLTSA